MDDGSEVIALVTVAAGMTISGWILGSPWSDVAKQWLTQLSGAQVC